jgi:broad specificity phosphatase PhoE
VWNGLDVNVSILFMQHGESENNVLGRIGGDANLSPRGRKYAQSLARHMNEVKIEGLKVWTSELRRTKQTAEGIDASAEHMASLNELHAVSVCKHPQLCTLAFLNPLSLNITNGQCTV